MKFKFEIKNNFRIENFKFLKIALKQKVLVANILGLKCPGTGIVSGVSVYPWGKI